MSFIDKVNGITAAKKEQKSKKAKAVKSPRTLAFDYFETADRLNSLKGKDSESHKKIQRELSKLRKELDKNSVGHQKLDVFYKSYLKGKVK